MENLSISLYYICFLLLLQTIHLQTEGILDISNNPNDFNEDEGKVIGKFTYQDSEYKAICSCSPSTPLDSSSLSMPKCDPSKLTITQERSGIGATVDDVRQVIGKVEELDYVDVLTTAFNCLDGRHKNPILSTPGGEAGEFLLALAVYEDLLNRQLTQENVDSFLRTYLKNLPFDQFTFCTDDAAISHLEEDLNAII